MIRSILNKFTAGLLLMMVSAFGWTVYAEGFDRDLFIGAGDVRVEEGILKSEMVRIYVTVHNASTSDLSGVVKFYDERIGQFIAPDQPVSILAGRTDDVFIDWSADLTGNHPIAVRIVPWQDEGDDPSNNKVVKPIYIDVDSDQDGLGDRVDSDDDNDGTADQDDQFPYDPTESKDTDGDGTGDNADSDDDGDGKPDIEDAFPLDAKESQDTDGDGVGDNFDVFPFDATEAFDLDGDGLGDNSDPDDENHGPQPFIFMSETTARRGTMLTFNALKSRDPDGEIVLFEWDFGDGMNGEGVITEHAFEETGSYIVTLKVTDDRGEYREQQIQIEVGLDYGLAVLLIVILLLIFLLLGLFLPNSRFHHKKLKLNWKSVEQPKKGKKKR